MNHYKPLSQEILVAAIHLNADTNSEVWFHENALYLDTLIWKERWKHERIFKNLHCEQLRYMPDAQYETALGMRDGDSDLEIIAGKPCYGHVYRITDLACK
jgi:hypothetical protein